MRWGNAIGVHVDAAVGDERDSTDVVLQWECRWDSNKVFGKKMELIIFFCFFGMYFFSFFFFFPPSLARKREK